MNCRRVVDHSRCYFHPDLALVGVCPLCLNDRLVVLAAARHDRLRRLFSSCARRAHRCNRPSRVGSKKTPINILKIFAIGSVLNRLEFRHRSTDGLDGACDASSSLEDDSFISIKFEDNGLVSWEKKKVSKVSLGNCNIPWNHRDMVGTAPPLKGAKTTMTKIMIEHPRPRVSLLGWRKRFGHLFHLIRWRRSSKAGGFCHAGSNVEGGLRQGG